MESEVKFNLKPALTASALILVAMLILTIIAWVKIPAGQPIAIHWGISGQPDGFASKPFALLFIPVIALFEAGLFALIAKVEPRRRNIKLSLKAYTAIWISSLILLLIVHALVILTALGWKISMNVLMSTAVGLLFIVIGNYLPKLRSNFFAGIRTPWTLSSELSWSKTHRLGGKLFIIYGLLILIAGFFLDAATTFWLLTAGILSITIFLTMYSYIIWKSDPNKIGADGEAAVRNNTAIKKLIIAIAVISIVVIAALVYLGLRPPPPDIMPKARAVVQAMANSNFEGATKDFDATMKAALPPEKLKSTWESLTTQIGPFQKELRTRTERSFPFTIVYVTCKFEKEDAAFKVVFSSSGKISGLWIVPAQ